MACFVLGDKILLVTPIQCILMATNFDLIKIFENKFIVQCVKADLYQACNLIFVYKCHHNEVDGKDYGNRYSLSNDRESNTGTLVQRMSLDAEK